MDKAHRARVYRATTTIRRVSIDLVNGKKEAVKSGAVVDATQFSGKDILSTLGKSKGFA